MITKKAKNTVVSLVLLIGISFNLPVFLDFAIGAMAPQNNYRWVGDSGNWSDPSRWVHLVWDSGLGEWVTAPGVPGPGDNANIGSGPATIQSSTNAVCEVLDVGSVIQQGNLTVTDYLCMAFSALSIVESTYTLQSGRLSTYETTVGYHGDATFTQEGGSHDTSTFLYVGIYSGSEGTYTLENGAVSANDLTIGGTDATGTFNQSGGELVVDTIFLGWGGIGNFKQKGGNVTINSINIASIPPGETTSQGIYEHLGGTINVEDEFDIREGGSFIMNGGTINAIRADAELIVEAGASLTGPGTFNIDVVYESEREFGDGDDFVDIVFKQNGLIEGGACNVDKLAPANFAGGTGANLLASSVCNVTFDGQFSGEFTIVIPYDEADIAGLDENKMRLRILHVKEGQNTVEQLENVQIDTVNNVVYGQADSFGKFALDCSPFLTFNVTQPPVYNICQLDPASLTLKSIDGREIYKWECFSGANVVYNWELMINNSRFARWKYLGPIPPGVWRVGSRGWRNGKNQYPLYPVFGTETFGRDKFYIHGTADLNLCPDSVGASQGCIAIMPGQYESTFIPQFENAPNVLDALIQRQLLLYVDNFPDKMYPPVLGKVKVIVKSPANLFLQNVNEHVCGYDPDLGEVINDIDGATYSGPGTEPQILTYPLYCTNPVIDHLTLFPIGEGGPYELEVSYEQPDGSVVTAKHASQILPGQPIEYTITITPESITLSPSELPTIPASIDIDPDTLNLKSKGKWLTCYIELPDGFDVSLVDSRMVELDGVQAYIGKEGWAQAEANEGNITDHDNDGIPERMVKFESSEVLSLLTIGDAPLTLYGVLPDGTIFVGMDTIKVIDKKNK